MHSRVHVINLTIKHCSNMYRNTVNFSEMKYQMVISGT